MATQQIPVTREVIRWARTRAGYTLETASKDFKKIEDWEREGGSFPTYIQLEKLAAKFKIPVAVFFFPEPPDTPNIEESFRTLGSEIFKNIPPRIRLLLRKAQAFQIGLEELNRGRNPAERIITNDLKFDTLKSVDSLAENVREYLGISIEEQLSWDSPETALKNWRTALNSVGVYVFKDAFRQNDYSGFCLYDKNFPIIYVNNSTSKTRQMFTLFHELAHLLFETSGVDKIKDDFLKFLPEGKKKVEVACNLFASRFLVPEDVFQKHLQGKEADEQTATLLASLFNVSREVIFRKFLDKKLITKEKYDFSVKEWNKQKRSGKGGDHYNNVIAYLGTDYIRLAFSEYYNNRINANQLADYLDTKPKNIPTLEEYISRRAS